MADITKQPVHRDTERTDGNYSTGDISAVPVTKTADYNITAEDYYLLGDSSGGSFSFYLPPAADVPSVVFVIKKIVSSNLVTIIPNGVETIEGSSSAILSVQYDYISIMSDGTNWIVNGETPTLAQVLAVGSNGGGAIITNTIWNGSVVGLAYGGTNANLTAVNGGVVYSTATAMAITVAGSSGQIIRGAGAAAPTWSTATYPDTITANQVLYATGTNAIGSSADLTYNGAGVLAVTKSQNLGTYNYVLNATSGTSAYSGVYVANTAAFAGNYAGLISLSAGYSSSGMFTAGASVLYTNSTTGLHVGNYGNGPLNFYTNNTHVGRFLSTGQLIVGATTLVSTEFVSFQKNQNAGTYVRTSNSTSGTAAYTGYLATDNSTITGIYHINTSFTTSGISVANTGVLATSATAGLNMGSTSNTQASIWTNNTKRILIPAAGGLVVGIAALATIATDGFLYIPTSNGIPTGVPSAQTGTVALEYDTANNNLYIYNGAWKKVALA